MSNDNIKRCGYRTALRDGGRMCKRPARHSVSFKRNKKITIYYLCNRCIHTVAWISFIERYTETKQAEVHCIYKKARFLIQDSV